MKGSLNYIFLVIVYLNLSGCNSVKSINKIDYKAHTQNKYDSSPLLDKKWFHGSPNCDSNSDPSIEVFQYEPSSYILRQNKCLNFEAPFIYLLFGNKKLLVLDTGATENELHFPLYKTIQAINKKVSASDGRPMRKLLVVHSHSHGDHHAGDQQFLQIEGVKLIKPNKNAMRSFFGFTQWPEDEVKINLGARELIIIPTPGHQEESITIYR